MVNKVILIGNLGRDPEVRTTTSGQPVASFSLATNRRWTDRSGQRQEQTEWHNIVCWGRQAEIAGQSAASTGGGDSSRCGAVVPDSAASYTADIVSAMSGISKSSAITCHLMRCASACALQARLRFVLAPSLSSHAP